MGEEIYGLWLTGYRELSLRGAITLYRKYQSLEQIFNLDWPDLVATLAEGKVQQTNLTRTGFEKHRKKLETYRNYYAKIKDKGIDVLAVSAPNFPVKLLDISDCPIVLYYRGKPQFPTHGIAIVGARRSSYYGNRVAYRMGKELAEQGINVVSGLAYGIDVNAHIGALAGEGFTTAVMGGGLQECYPKQNKKIFDQIVNKGCILSEEPYGTKTMPYMFPKRNRIVSGISDGVLVVEASKKSGSLITVDFALEQGREVFAIPNRLYEELAQGTSLIARQGAKLVYQVDDILQEICDYEVEIAIKKQKKDEKIEKSLEEMEKMVYSFISYKPIHEDLIVSQMNNERTEMIASKNKKPKDTQPLSSDDIRLSLLGLQLKGYVSVRSGHYYRSEE